MDRSKPEDTIAQITELFMTGVLRDQLVTDESGKPRCIGETEFDDDELLEDLRLHFEPQLSKARLERGTSLDDWWMVREAIYEVAATDNLAELKKQRDKLQKILDDAGDISVMTLFFELQRKAMTMTENYKSLAVTTEPDVLLKHGVDERTIDEVKKLHAYIPSKIKSEDGKKGGKQQSSAQKKNERIHIECYKKYKADKGLYKNLSAYFNDMRNKTGSIERTVRNHLKKHGLIE